MNTNPNATVVLCFGDSNTWGQKPDKTGRYLADVRWTGQLQDLLGAYYIIEEGLGSRTTDLEYDKKPGRNGKSYLQPCLEGHNPIDVVLLMLGTNDLKMQYSRTADEIAQAIQGLVDDIKEYGKNKQGDAPKIILMSPILIDDTAPRFAEFYTGYYDHRSFTESEKLAVAIQKVATETNCGFIDASSVSKPGEDGIHFSPDSHIPLAELIANELRTS